jgi:hypothetical protein
MRFGIRRTLLLIASLPIFWIAACGALWWCYDIGSLIHDGYFNRSQAHTLVIQMGLILTILTTATWIWSTWVAKEKALLVSWWSATWKTLLILFVYLFAALLRRGMWTQSQGVNDYAMFLPLVGHINAMFFSEFRWISFLIQVIPCMGVLSGALFCIQERFGGRTGSHR